MMLLASLWNSHKWVTSKWVTSDVTHLTIASHNKATYGRPMSVIGATGDGRRTSFMVLTGRARVIEYSPY